MLGSGEYGRVDCEFLNYYYLSYSKIPLEYHDGMGRWDMENGRQRNLFSCLMNFCTFTLALYEYCLALEEYR